MAIIIGSATVVGGWSGVVSAQWGINPQVNRLWQLGSWAPYQTQVTTVETVNLTIYAGGAPTSPGLGNLQAATSCNDSQATMSVTISPQPCGGSTVPGINGTYFLTSYSYSKGDAIGLGQQSYSLQKWVAGSTDTTQVKYTKAPSATIQGSSEGNEAKDTGLNTGVTFSTGYNVTGSQGSVSAGFPGIGTATSSVHGIANSVQATADLKNDGKTGQAQVTIPHQPLYF